MIPNNNAGQFEGLEHLNLSNPEVDEAAAAAHLAQQQEQYTEGLPTAMQEEQAQEQQAADLETEKQEIIQRRRDERGELTTDDLPLTAITQGIDGLLGTNLTDTYVQNQNEGAKKGDELAAEIETSDDILSEGVRAVIGGRMDAVNQALNTGELIGDTAKTWLGIASEEDNIYSDEYERANWNLTASENRTKIGQIVRGGFKIHTAMFGLKKLGVGGQATGRTVAARTTRVAQEALRGAIADVIVTDPSDGTITQQIGELFGIEEDSPFLGPLVTAMTVDEDDNPWKAKLLAAAEGGVLGMGVDALGEVIGAFRTVRRFDQANAKRLKTKEARKAAAEAELDRHTKEVMAEMEQMKAQVKADAADPGVQGEIDFSTSNRQMSLEDFGLDMTPAQTRTVRETQDVLYGGSPSRPAQFEVDEKAARITTNDINEVGVSQAAVDGFEGATNGRSTKSLFTDAAVKKMTTVATSAEEADGLRQTVQALNSRIDVDAISKQLGQTNEETMRKSFNVIRRFMGANDLSPEDALKTFDDMKGRDAEGNEFLSREGVFAARTIITDLSMQLNDLAGNSMDLVAAGRELPSAQANMIVDRLQGLSRMYKESSIHYGSGLQSFKLGPLRIGKTADEVAQELKKTDEFFENMKGKLEEGDPKAVKEFQDLAQGLAMADGDPLKQMTVKHLMRELGGKAMLKVMYNSMLSGPITHARNTIGNLSTMVLRPTTMAIGQAMSGDINAAKASISSLSAVSDAFSEALTAGGKAWSTGVPAGGAKFDVQDSEVARGLELIKANAKTDSERRAANFLDMLHNNAVLNAPTRALAAGDDFFKIMNARIELKRQTMMETLSETGTLKFDPDKYAQIAEGKIVNGEVTDDGLLRIAKEQTFQQDLEGTMKQVSDLLDKNPLTKYAVPFVRTPHNLMVYAGTYTPGINRFLKEAQDIRNGTDEAAKAVLKGRVAMGYGVLATGFGYAAAGNLTGNGPADPELRKIWLQSNQPQSIKIGDKWVSYASIEPLNVMFAAAADLQHAAPYLQSGEYDRMVSQLQFTFAKAFFERSYMKGVQTAIGYLNPQTAGNVNVAREGLNALNTFIPFSGLRRQMAKALAPDVYEFNNELQASLTKSWPGGNYLSGAESAVDIFTGKRKIDTKDPGILFHFANQFLPFNISQDNSDFVIDKLGELQIDTRTDFGDTYKGLELTAEDRAGINRLVAKGDLHGRLEKLMKSRDFQQQLQDWQKTVDQGITAPREEQLWYKSITRMISQSRLRAASQYAALPREETDDFGGRLQTARYRKQLQGKGRYDELINFGN